MFNYSLNVSYAYLPRLMRRQNKAIVLYFREEHSGHIKERVRLDLNAFSWLEMSSASRIRKTVYLSYSWEAMMKPSIRSIYIFQK